MNLTLIGKFQDVKKYSMYDNKILCINKDCFVIKDLGGTQLFMIESPKDGFIDIYINNHKIFLRFSNDYRTIIINPKNYEFDELEFLIVFNSEILSDIIFLCDKQKNTYCYDLNKKAIISRIDDRIVIVHANEKVTIGYTGIFNGGILKCYNLNKGEKMWEFDPLILGNWYNEGEVKNYVSAMVIGEFNSKLYVRYIPRIIVVLDIVSGNEISRIDIPFYSTSFVLCNKSNKIFCMVDIYIIEINLENYQINQYSIEENLLMYDIKGINDSGFTHHNDKHIFVYGHEIIKDYSDKNFKQSSFILAINKENRLIDWHYKVPYLNENPRLFENYLLQKDSENNLHVFEIL